MCHLKNTPNLTHAARSAVEECLQKVKDADRGSICKRKQQYDGPPREIHHLRPTSSFSSWRCSHVRHENCHKHTRGLIKAKTVNACLNSAHASFLYRSGDHESGVSREKKKKPELIPFWEANVADLPDILHNHPRAGKVGPIQLPRPACHKLSFDWIRLAFFAGSHPG